MNLISKHLPKSALIDKGMLKRFAKPQICCFTGQVIEEGVPKELLIKDTFKDHDLIRYPSQYIGVETAMMIAEIIKGKEKEKDGQAVANMNALRVYNCYFSETEARIGLKRSEVLDLAIDIPEAPFILLATFSNKKHIAYKASPQYDKHRFVITTDKRQLDFDLEKVRPLLNIVRSWYTVKPEHINSESAFTYFSQDQILGLKEVLPMQISEYGRDKFREENRFLQTYRKTLLLDFIVNFNSKTFPK